MPYISDETQHELQHRGYPMGAGELHFVLANVCKEYLNGNGQSYQTHNDILGALGACQQEWYRRVVSHYEEVKMRENGDVFYDAGEDPGFNHLVDVIKYVLAELRLAEEPEKKRKRRGRKS